MKQRIGMCNLASLKVLRRIVTAHTLWLPKEIYKQTFGGDNSKCSNKIFVVAKFQVIPSLIVSS